MSTPNERDEAFVALPDLVLGMVPAAEAERLMVIVNSSATLQSELASLRGTANALAHAAPPTPMLVAKKAAMRDRLLAQGAEPLSGPPDDLRKLLVREREVWGKVIRDAGVKAD